MIQSKLLLNSLIVLAVGFVTLSAQASLPKATIDDYVWEMIEGPIYPNWGEDCYSKDEPKYRACLDQSAMIYNQNLIEKLQLSKYVSRQLNQTTITIPNHEAPIILTDTPVQDIDGDGLRYVYLINRYDEDKNWLYLSGQVYETNNTVFVDLNTGATQNFEGSHLMFSPDMTYAATVKVEFPGEEEVLIWKKDKHGNYQYDKSNIDYDKFRQHFKFYNSREDSLRPYSVKLEWVTDDSLLVDFYFKMNERDTIAYRVRFNYVKTEPTSDWQMIPIK
ncbi:hypothetical protein [Psychrobacter sp. AOP7-B1-24]|uniref:hypothetical protein n=1 Tax=Psychrobacter sp. AOP7-B1-24 TaxID=3457645 RepID=UPI00402B8FCE